MVTIIINRLYGNNKMTEILVSTYFMQSSRSINEAHKSRSVVPCHDMPEANRWA